jgi:hypothetical protein
MSDIQEKHYVMKPETTAEERTWAALAHGSTMITIAATIVSAGLAGLLLPFVPLVIYLAYKDKSDFIARHAAQAFALQVMSTIGWLIAFIVAIFVIVLAWVITGLLSIILVGLLLIPVATLITIALPLVLVLLPLVALGLSVIAAVETYNGTNYRYPYLGRWVFNWLELNKAESNLEITPEQRESTPMV